MAEIVPVVTVSRRSWLTQVSTARTMATTKGASIVPCYLLHLIEMPERTPYADADLKDLVGAFPQLFCAYCNPPRHLMPSEGSRCLDRTGPCWKPVDTICESAG